ncbi:hypothetical protein RIF29_11722 [Crotalaria pallida]|uniref:Uncharacterized protein n=1 Tax=Crotalaria pallida TaxID=3830 RepID=A0AAN9P0G1_CROPI
MGSQICSSPRANRRERRKCPRWFVSTLSSKPSAVIVADFAALSVLRKSLQAIITCHFPVSAKALADARPNPEEAPVTTTLPFLKVFLPSGAAFFTAGVVVTAVWALTTPTDSAIESSDSDDEFQICEICTTEEIGLAFYGNIAFKMARFYCLGVQTTVIVWLHMHPNDPMILLVKHGWD